MMRLKALGWVIAGTLGAAIANAPAAANSEEWRVTPAPHTLQNGEVVCGLYSPNPARSVGFSAYDHSSDLVIKTTSLIGVADGANAVLRFPSGQSHRVKLGKESAEADTAVVSISTLADLGSMIDHFAAAGDFSVAVLGGRPSAFKISALPDASAQIVTFRGCMKGL